MTDLARRALSLAFIIIPIASQLSPAETFVPTTGPAAWIDTNNWNPNTVPNAVGATAIFETPTATRMVTLASDVTVGTLSFTNNSTFTTSIGA